MEVVQNIEVTTADVHGCRVGYNIQPRQTNDESHLLELDVVWNTVGKKTIPMF